MQWCIESLNIYDDIIIFGRDQDKHDMKLGNISKCFEQKQLPVNAKKRNLYTDTKCLYK